MSLLLLAGPRDLLLLATVETPVNVIGGYAVQGRILRWGARASNCNHLSKQYPTGRRRHERSQETDQERGSLRAAAGIYIHR